MDREILHKDLACLKLFNLGSFNIISLEFLESLWSSQRSYTQFACRHMKPSLHAHLSAPDYPLNSQSTNET